MSPQCAGLAIQFVQFLVLRLADGLATRLFFFDDHIQLLESVLSLGQVLAVTAMAGISQAYGSGKFKEAWGLFTAFVLISIGLGIVAAVGAFFGADTYVSWFTNDPETRRQGTLYFQINALTFFSQLLLIVIGNAFRASGDFITDAKSRPAQNEGPLP